MKNILHTIIAIFVFLLLGIQFAFGQKEVIIHINTDSYPQETRWVLHVDSIYGPIVGQVNYGHYTLSNTSHTDTLYLADSVTNISFVIYDSYGDGITGSGSYYVSICGDTIVNYPNPSFTTGLISNRVVPQCMPNPPPQGPCVPAMVNINLDQYQSETTWEITDTSGNLLYAGGPYSTAPDYQPQFEPVCLPVGPLLFTIYDSYGDGLAGSLWGGNDGSYYLIQCGDTLVYGTEANFGTDSAHVFISDTCTPPPPVPGCMDEDYVEYNPYATVDDSSCVTLKIWGCTDSNMFNYDPLANTMDYIDSCDYTLILHDLVGNGWVGSKLEIYQEDKDTAVFYMTNASANQTFSINLYAPEVVQAKFFVTSQAQHTALECGFTLINPFGDTVISVVPPFIIPFQTYTGITYCGNTCVEVVEGCMDSLAFNYIDSANTSLPCYYNPGCTSPAYLDYHVDTANGIFRDFHVPDSCQYLAIFGCTDFLAFNYNPLANVDNGGCLPVVLGCMDAFAFNYNPQANTPDTCIPFVYGCTSPIAFNYDSLANTDDGSCIGVNYGCTDSTMWNYSPSANVDDGTCIPYIYGCMDPMMFNYNPNANTDNGNCIPFIYGCMDTAMFNYNPLANTDNGTCIPYIYGCTNPIALNYCDTCNTDDFSCILPIYGCTDSTMFNYNPLANVDNNSCIPFVYGCTDPSMLNYNPQANTEDFSCIPYIYGCMDSTAFNYDSLANTDNGSCISVVEGCMDVNAYNYDELANVNDSANCLYDAGCITGPGVPYWLNDPCYAWVISVDDYCCENEWDTICQLTYNYCDSSWSGPIPTRKSLEEALVVYPNPTQGKININKNVDVSVFGMLGDMIISKQNTNVLDVVKLSPGTYNLMIKYNNEIYNKIIIKE